MYREINLRMADGTEKLLPFVANGATSLRFRMIFGKELMESIVSIFENVGSEKIAGLLSLIQEEGNGEETQVALEDLSPDMLKLMVSIAGSGELETIYKLAYIMNRAAEGALMRALDVEGYLDWLEQFEAMELLSHAMDFIGLYMGNKTTTSTQKKKSTLRAKSKHGDLFAPSEANGPLRR